MGVKEKWIWQGKTFASLRNWPKHSDPDHRSLANLVTIARKNEPHANRRDHFGPDSKKRFPSDFSDNTTKSPSPDNCPYQSDFSSGQNSMKYRQYPETVLRLHEGEPIEMTVC
jgi:hypothetical protein